MWICLGTAPGTASQAPRRSGNAMRRLQPQTGSAMTTVVLSEPDRLTRRLAVAALRFAGYAVETARSTRHTRTLLHRCCPAVAVLDPGGDVEAVSALRAVTDIPLIVVSSSGEEWDKVAMLDAGADDYLTKPYGIEELLARIRVLLRRSPPATATTVAPVTTPDFTIDVADRRWTRSDGTEVALTPTEWRLVEILTRHPGRLVTQTELLVGVWGPKAIEKTVYLRVYLTGIRHKVEPDPAHPRYFITAPGLGLRFDPRAGRVGQPC
jgi:two-component system, OmpR family, KDP operon response regulator KdpE